tara:strand:- start:7330 stop:8253 length:924 start_codon:yes stop_codon:yes gene_type:complete
MKIKKPKFWNEKNILSYFLYPISFLTLIINQIKKFSNKKKFLLKTICVGNIYLGGTGKTSLSIMINKILKKKYKTVFVKKFYKDQIDEQNQLKSNGNLISDEKREYALKTAQDLNYEVAILDDGLQQKNINYDLSITCFNSSAGIGNGFLLPAGPLRENISALKSYDAVFINGEKKNIKLNYSIKKINSNIEIFEAKYEATNLKKINRNKNFLIFSGLGNPQEFENTLKKYKFKIKEKIIFPDHYNFSNSEIKKLKNVAKNKKLEILTTEKDYFRLSKKNKKNIKFLKVDLRVINKKRFIKFLQERL